MHLRRQAITQPGVTGVVTTGVQFGTAGVPPQGAALPPNKHLSGDALRSELAEAGVPLLPAGGGDAGSGGKTGSIAGGAAPGSPAATAPSAGSPFSGFFPGTAATGSPGGVTPLSAAGAALASPTPVGPPAGRAP